MPSLKAFAGSRATRIRGFRGFTKQGSGLLVNFWHGWRLFGPYEQVCFFAVFLWVKLNRASRPNPGMVDGRPHRSAKGKAGEQDPAAGLYRFGLVRLVRQAEKLGVGPA